MLLDTKRPLTRKSKATSLQRDVQMCERQVTFRIKWINCFFFSVLSNVKAFFAQVASPFSPTAGFPSLSHWMDVMAQLDVSCCVSQIAQQSAVVPLPRGLMCGGVRGKKKHWPSWDKESETLCAAKSSRLNLPYVLPVLVLLYHICVVYLRYSLCGPSLSFLKTAWLTIYVAVQLTPA